MEFFHFYIVVVGRQHQRDQYYENNYVPHNRDLYMKVWIQQKSIISSYKLEKVRRRTKKTFLYLKFYDLLGCTHYYEYDYYFYYKNLPSRNNIGRDEKKIILCVCVCDSRFNFCSFFVRNENMHTFTEVYMLLKI